VLTPKEEDEFEASVARALGFPADELSEAEAEAGLGGARPRRTASTCSVRNHILARWQCNVMSKVSLNQVGGLGPECKRTCGSSGCAGYGAARRRQNAQKETLKNPKHPSKKKKKKKTGMMAQYYPLP